MIPAHKKRKVLDIVGFFEYDGKANGETGENPVRARRRKAHDSVISDGNPPFPETPLRILEKVMLRRAKSKYPFAKSSFFCPRAPDL